MRLSALTLVIVLIALLGSATLRAQPSISKLDIRLTQPLRERDDTLIVVHADEDSATVEIREPDGGTQMNVSPEDFAVVSTSRGKGEIFAIDTIKTGNPATHVGFVVDDSKSMFRVYTTAVNSLGKQFRELNARWSGVLFDDSVRHWPIAIAARKGSFVIVSEQTASFYLMKAFLQSFYNIRSSWTPLYDGIAECAAQQNYDDSLHVAGSHIVIVVADGDDNASVRTVDEVGALVKDPTVRLFAIVFTKSPRMKWLAHRGHGEYFEVYNWNEFGRVLSALRHSLFRSYVLRYRFAGPAAATSR